MKKLNNTYVDSLLTKILNETIQERADEIASKLTDKGKKGDKFPDLTGDGELTYADILKGRGVELGEGGDVCECGGEMYEGECMECGKSSWMEEETDEDIYDVSGKFPKHQSFDYVQEEDDMDVMDFEDEESEEKEENSEFCKYQKNKIDNGDLTPEEKDDFVKRFEEKCSNISTLARKPISMNERLRGGQSKIDKNKNGKIDAEDFKMLRGETNESEKFIQKATKKMEKKGTEGSFKKYCGGEVTKSCIDKAMKSGDPKLVKKANFAKNIKAYKGAEHKESITMTESEMIDLIEKIIKEDKLKATTKPKGLATYEKAHKGSGKENNDYLQSVTKKMKDYLKDGSKGEYSMEPKMFPKGNGELAKMDKMAYVPDEATKEYTDNFTAAGLENLVYDEIHPNEEWADSNIEGSSKTGNNPEWANAVDTGVNKKRNKIRKDNLLGAVKQMAYNKAPQPVVDDVTKGAQGKFERNFGKGAGKKATKILNQLESVEEKENKQINEEFERMKNLISYNQKTQ
jgi:hypothetical protein